MNTNTTRAMAHRALDRALDAAQSAEETLVRATLRALCLEVSAAHPDAVAIDFDFSDQGDHLLVTSIDTTTEKGIEYRDEPTLAWHLVGAFDRTWTDYLSQRSDSGLYRAVIAEVLEAIEHDELAA